MIKNVIDISSYQKPELINYDILAKNINGAILRVGYTGYGTGESLNKDTTFETHYKELKKRGVPIGAYWYSCANTEEEGKREALFMSESLKGKTFELPIYWDTEDTHHQSKVSPTLLSKTGIAFLETLENLGYYVGIYASTSWLNNRLDMNLLKDYDVWVAHYGVDKPSYNKPYGAWQYTAMGRIDGYNYDLDVNILYKDYPTIIKNGNFNNFKKVKSAVKGNVRDSKLKVGDWVKIKENSHSYNGEKLAKFVYMKPYRIDELSGNRAVLDKKGIHTAIHTDNLLFYNPSYKVGDYVKVKAGAKDYNGTSIASFVYGNVYRIDEISGDRVLLDKKGICTAFNKIDLYK